MIIQREKFEDVYPEIYPIAKENFEEVESNQDVIPFDIDIDRMVMLEKLGNLVLFTGRFGGQLGAYSIFVLANSLHSKEIKYAVNDVFYVKPEFRGRPVLELLNFCEEQLKNLGIQVLVYHVKTVLDWSSLLGKKGFTMTETAWQKILGE